MCYKKSTEESGPLIVKSVQGSLTSQNHSKERTPHVFSSSLSSYSSIDDKAEVIKTKPSKWGYNFIFCCMLKQLFIIWDTLTLLLWLDLPLNEAALERITIYNNTTVDDTMATTAKPVLI